MCKVPKSKTEVYIPHTIQKAEVKLGRVWNVPKSTQNGEGQTWNLDLNLSFFPPVKADTRRRDSN